MNIKFTDEGMEIDGVVWPLYSGAIHYWRLERSLWSELLDSVVRLGFRFVETYIPWSIHEVNQGQFDFGEIDPNKDLGAFLSLCHDKNLKVLVRPGPHINAEMSNFGFPEWVLHNPENQALSPWGMPVQFPFFTQTFPLPSYASESFYREVEVYFSTLAPILLENQYPKGPIVGIQTDNETCYFFRDRAYSADYSKDSIRMYQKMLFEKYGSVENINEAYESEYASIDEIPPPDGFRAKSRQDIPYYLDWVIYKEYQVVYSVKRLARFWKTTGLSVPVFHNSAWQTYTPIDMVGMESSEVDVCGIDIYANYDSSERVKNTVKYMAGTSRLAFIPEFGSGAWFDNQQTFQPDEQEFISMYAFMHGLKAANYYMIVERDRWQGSPITRDNRIRHAYYDSFDRILTFLMDRKLHLYRRKPQSLVMKSVDAARYKSAYSLMDPNPFVSNTFIRGFELPLSLFKPKKGVGFVHLEREGSSYMKDDWALGISRVLDQHGIDYNISDTQLSLEKMLAYPVIFCSAYEFMDSEIQRKLMDYSREGGKLIIGPCIPEYDERLQPNRILEQIEVIEHPEHLDPAQLSLQAQFVSDMTGIELVPQEYENRTLLFAANVTGSDLRITIRFSGNRLFKPAWNAEEASGDGSVQVLMRAYSVTVWEVEGII